MNTDVIRLQRTIGIGGAITVFGLLAVGFPLYLSRGPDRTAFSFLTAVNVQQFILLFIVFTGTAIVRHKAAQTVQVVVILFFGYVTLAYGAPGALTGLAILGLGVTTGALYGLADARTRTKVAMIVVGLLVSLYIQALQRADGVSTVSTMLEFVFSSVGALGLVAAYLIVIREVVVAVMNRRESLEREVASRTAEWRVEVQSRRKAEDAARASAERAEQLALDRFELLQQVHHRAKNSLQMTLTLLESLDTTSPEALTATINRVRAIGLVYDLVDAAEDLSSIVLEDYIERLVWYLQMSYGDRPVSIAYDARTNKHRAQLEATINLGLLIHEMAAIAAPHTQQSAPGTIHIYQSASSSSIDFEIHWQTGDLSVANVLEQLKSPTALVSALIERLQIKLESGNQLGIFKMSVPKGVIVRSTEMPTAE